MSNWTPGLCCELGKAAKEDTLGEGGRQLRFRHKESEVLGDIQMELPRRQLGVQFWHPGVVGWGWRSGSDWHRHGD